MTMPQLPTKLAWKQFAGNAAKGVGRTIGLGVESAVATGVVTGGVMAAHKAYGALTKARDFRNMMNSPFNAELKDLHDSDPHRFNAAFTSLRSVNAPLTQDPMTAGAYMKRIMTFDNAGATGVMLEALNQKERMPVSPVLDAVNRNVATGIQSSFADRVNARSDRRQPGVEGGKLKTRLDMNYDHTLEKHKLENAKELSRFEGDERVRRRAEEEKAKGPRPYPNQVGRFLAMVLDEPFIKVAEESVAGFSRGGSSIYLNEDPAVKLASGHTILDSVRRFLSVVEPQEGVRYLLVNAMGAHEYWGPNSNNDAWPEAALCHLPAGWSGDPARDIPLTESTSWIKARPQFKPVGWPYGLPTFYRAHAYAHHVNKDPARAVGNVVFSDWNDAMKRVELVMKLEREKCYRFNARDFWDRMADGDFPAVSMGAKVPWDRCSVSTDMDEFRAALASFDPRIHVHPGIAVLRWHERKIKERGYGIPGIARTRREYGELMRSFAGRVDPKTGRLVFVFNDFPAFFDISLVRRGADKTAYGMISIGPGERMQTKLAASNESHSLLDAQGKMSRRKAFSLQEALESPLGGSTLAEAKENYGKAPVEAAAKVASYSEELPPASYYVELEKEAASLAVHRKEATQKKRGEIDKRIDAEIERVTRGEGDIPGDVLQAASKLPLQRGLTQFARMGVVLRPREFTQLCLMKKLPEMATYADLLELPAPSMRCPAMDLCGDDPEPYTDLARALLTLIKHLLPSRSGFDQFLRPRLSVTILPVEEGDVKKRREGARKLASSSLPQEFLSKLGMLYGSYRAGTMQLAPHIPDFLDRENGIKLAFTHGTEPEELFTPLSYRYLQVAYLNELGADRR